MTRAEPHHVSYASHAILPPSLTAGSSKITIPGFLYRYLSSQIIMFGFNHCILRSARIHLKPPRARPPLAQSTLARLLSTLTILEQREGKLLHGSLCAVAAASKLGGSIDAIIAGSGTKQVAEEAAKVPGLEKVIVVENGAYDRVRYMPRYLSSISCLNSCRAYQKTMRHCSSRISK